MITDRDVERFQKLYLDRFGVLIDEADARDELTLLVAQMHAIYRPVLRSDVEALRNVDVGNNDKQTDSTA